ncbi:MAG TPA: hypothetical protein VJY12_02490 [Dysgonamonadaceae bacterium]|nr:hypothetical protein [Dysgonamonadaceae bacterium]
MKLKEQIKINWPFAVATLIFGVLAILQVKDIYKNDTLFGGSYILISATLSYSSFKEAELLKQEGHKLFNLPIYASGVLSGMWLIRALELFF